eukprot:MONOS_2386.1-p1 / transcript=MONOS_2386.1 / gene=MONOS_2386 / organism=Monocercomonoides_exilis_PA203 / gene_product=unspecified product / transcript_product=unspecified product / location=Mono_scaffold00049:43668-44654(+) / protein_length=267 / sequence_SO=supercontig / SO=protein_coding / is_pseudo=false
MNLIIVGRAGEKMENTVHEIQTKFKDIQVKSVFADLSADPVVTTQAVLQQIEGLDISFIALNAGSGVPERMSRPNAKSLDLFHLNIVTHQHLFNALYPQLAKRPKQNNSKFRGGVLITSSANAVFTAPFVASYSAAKAYQQHFAECLSLEAKVIGIDVVTVVPGGVATRFHIDAPPTDIKLPAPTNGQHPDAVASRALSSLGRFVECDSGLMPFGLRILAKIFDRNILLKIMMAVLPKTSLITPYVDENGNDRDAVYPESSNSKSSE